MNKKEEPKLVILSIDLGKVCGVAVHTSEGIEYTEEYAFVDLMQLQAFAKHLIHKWRPSLVLIPYPTRFYRVILQHAKMMGVIESVAIQFDTLVIEVQDSTCKKVVLGKGNAKKPDIAKHYKKIHPEIESEHILDAIMFIDWYLASV